MGILVGGMSRRMGRPKALIEVEDGTLLERTVEAAREVGGEVVLLGEPAFDLPAGLAGLPIEPDRHAGIGPIAGLEALLAAGPAEGGLLLACDMPHLCPALLRRLAGATGDFDAAACRTPEPRDDIGGRWHPCCGLYRPTALPEVQAAIAAGRFSLVALFGRLRVRPVDLAGHEARWVENWNAPDDLPPGAGPTAR